MAVTRVYISWNTGSPVVGQSANPDMDAFVLLPDGYDAERVEPYEWLFECFGAGATPRYYDQNDALGYQQGYMIANWYAAAGYVVVVPHQGGARRWANDASLAEIEKVYDYVTANYNLAPRAVLGGQSMGGLVALNVLKNNPERYKGCALIFPVSSLDAVHTPEAGNGNFNSEINTAYGCNNTTYEAVTAGHNPYDHFADYVTAGVTLRIWHGSSDTTVNPNHSTGFDTGTGGSLAEVSLVAGGTHSNLNSHNAYVSGIQAYLDTLPTETSYPAAGTVPATSTALGTVTATLTASGAAAATSDSTGAATLAPLGFDFEMLVADLLGFDFELVVTSGVTPKRPTRITANSSRPDVTAIGSRPRITAISQRPN